jgi:hypothetical protein
LFLNIDIVVWDQGIIKIVQDFIICGTGFSALALVNVQRSVTAGYPVLAISYRLFVDLLDHQRLRRLQTSIDQLQKKVVGPGHSADKNFRKHLPKAYRHLPQVYDPH